MKQPFSNLEKNLWFIITFSFVMTILNLLGLSIGKWFSIGNIWGMFIVNLVVGIVLVIYNE